jgi:ubiquinone biosynthesis protein UbiJ
MLALESPLVAALNHLLEAEPWARERLAPFAGQALELRAPPLPALRCAVASGGTLVRAAGEGPPALTITLGPQSLAALARGEDYFQRSIELAGNASLATEVNYLFRHLRWDAEEDLARLLGDAAAHRIVSAARSLLAAQRDAARRIADGLVEYAADERGMVVRRAELAAHGRAVAELRDALERLEARLARRRE